MKMVVMDLDGTLLRSDKSISDRTLKALNMLNSKGIKLVIATARAKRHVAKLLPFDFENMYIACYNGAEIYHGEKLIYYKYIDEKLVEDFVKRLRGKYPSINVALEISNCLYTCFDINVMKNWDPPYSRVDFFNFKYMPSAKILVDLREIEDISVITDNIPNCCKCTVTDGGTLAQISHSDISKLNAVKDILRILNIDLKDIIAFGDDYNDLEMLVECGRGVAMGNAPDEIKKIVGCCTLTNDEDGVAVEIENILDQMK